MSLFGSIKIFEEDLEKIDGVVMNARYGSDFDKVIKPEDKNTQLNPTKSGQRELDSSGLVSSVGRPKENRQFSGLSDLSDDARDARWRNVGRAAIMSESDALGL